MALVDGFLELERSSGKLEWSAILQKMASDLGFSKILFGLLPKDSQDYENAFIVGNYPAAWREHYDRAGYARVDPTVSCSAARNSSACCAINPTRLVFQWWKRNFRIARRVPPGYPN
ncbi:autoinducer binding domain-containing protein [Pseudomonas aeruginosa]